ncbi:MAG TPA: hypothetical protein VFZ16_09810 [Hyphomicrobiaceae bacterium]|nr:hypothetical protein [Hyphomicrobiaceae bacterium]
MSIYGARWNALRQSTAPPDYENARAAVDGIYAAAGLPPPQDVLWEDGPVELAGSWSRGRHTAGDSVRAVVIDAVRRKAELAVDRAIALSVRMALTSEPGLARLPGYCTTMDEALLRLGERALPILPMRFFDFFPRRRARATFASSGFSLQTAAWLGALQYLHDVCGLVRQTQSVAGLWELAQSACWIAPHEHVCWLVRRPRSMRCDANGRLHAADGPALCFGPDTTVYAWKGVIVPGRLIERPDLIDLRAIDAASDPQIRRCMIDIMTPQRFVENGGAHKVAEDDTGILWRQRWRWEAWAAVEVINGTPEPDGIHKRYFLQVPPTVRTPREGVAWTYGLSERQYRLAVRT